MSDTLESRKPKRNILLIDEPVEKCRKIKSGDDFFHIEFQATRFRVFENGAVAYLTPGGATGSTGAAVGAFQETLADEIPRIMAESLDTN